MNTETTEPISNPPKLPVTKNISPELQSTNFLDIGHNIYSSNEL